MKTLIEIKKSEHEKLFIVYTSKRCCDDEDIINDSFVACIENGFHKIEDISVLADDCSLEQYQHILNSFLYHGFDEAMKQM